MRLEIKLKTADKVIDALKSNFLSDLSQETIEQFFARECHKLISKPMVQWRKKNERLLIAAAKEYQTKYSTHWLGKFLLYCCDMELEDNVPFLLDIEILYRLIKAKKIKSSHPARLWKEIQRYSKDCAAFFADDLQDLEYILEAFTISPGDQ